MRSKLRLAAAAAVALAVLVGGCGGQADTFTIGVIVDCDGTFSAYSDTVLAGAELPLLARGGELVGRKASDGVDGARVAGRRVELRQGCGEITYLSQLIEHARRLVEEEKVDVLVAPMLGQTEGIVLGDLARRYPRVAFMLANTQVQEPTLRDPAPNLFRFVADGAQASAGLGAYAYHDLGWRSAAVVLSDSVFMWPQAAGFVAEFCALGGTVQRVRTPEYASASALSRIDKDADGVALFPEVFVDTLGFAAAFGKVQPDPARHLLLGPSAFNFSDPKLFANSAAVLRGLVVGGSTPRRSADPAWREFSGALHKHFPGDPWPASPADYPLLLPFYVSVEAALRALEQSGTDGPPFMRALSKTSFDSPIGPVRLDGNRQAIVPSYLSQVEVAPNGTPGFRTLRVVKDVEQTFGGYFGATTPTPTVSRPGCHAATPPRWAR